MARKVATTALLQLLLSQRASAEGSLRGLSVPSDHTDAPHLVSPAEQCAFVNPPQMPYFWDPNCKVESLGCWADGVHAECRFCGEAPYTGIHCPENSVVPSVGTCDFDNAPITPVYWEAGCHNGMKGCLADNKHVGCRFCGEGNYSDIPCPSDVCSFPNEPLTPYYWDDLCQMGMLGCNADGIHVQCRFCDKAPFQSLRCPGSARPAYGDKECWFPNGSPQTHYWDETCEWGKLGCWADGVNAQCRYCGSGSNGVYESIACP
eukprot:gb/GFBE01040670.1/.p1 GENE.gb/GFBE01040670.1/~~gb/GFBE01040670.1/.p1  ORF type:complete len:262 (+),score=42.56 gb/GFBE01040670.1/:1-786(+)